MSNLQMIEWLVREIEAQTRIIRALATRLAELGDVETCQDEIAEADGIYQDIIGRDAVEGPGKNEG